MKRCLSASCLTLALMSVGSPVEASEAAVSRIERFIERGLKDWETPGVVIAVVKDDEVVLADGYGVRELGKPQRPDAHTRLPIGSTSKAFGAAAVAALVGDGKLQWDDRVVDRLPWFELSDPWVTREVRLRDLLSHRVGLTLETEGRLYAAASSPADMVRRVRHLQPAFSFRSNYGYSNSMFTAGGLVVEAVTGKSWDAYTRERIWLPLGMTETTASVSEVLGIENRITGHPRIAGRLRPDPGWQLNRAVFESSGPSGAVISTATDMAQWLRLQLGEGRIGERQVIDWDAFRQMHVPHSPIREGPKQYAYWFTHLSAADLKSRHWSYGLGWVVNDYRGRKMVWHGGTINHVRTVVALLPEERVAIYVGANALSLFPFALALEAFDAFLGVDDADWSAVFAEQRLDQVAEGEAREKRLAQSRLTGTRPSLPLAGYAGRYEDGGAYGSLDVVAHDGRLEVGVGADRGELEHWHQDVFRIHWLPRDAGSTGFANFVLSPAGLAERLTIEGLGEFRRISDSSARAAWVAPQSEALVEWVSRHTAALRTIELDGGDDSDLRALGRLIEPDTRVIGFGEGPQHGMGEAMALRNRLFAHLVEHHGVTAYAAETSYTAGTLVDEYVTQGGRLNEDLLDFAYIAAAGRERAGGESEVRHRYSRQLLEWMREYNQRPGTRRPIRFYGIDSCPGSDCIRPAVEAALHYVQRLEPDAAQALGRRLEPFLDRAVIPAYGARIRQPEELLKPEERDVFTAAVGDLVALFAVRHVAWVRRTSSHEYHRAYRNAVVARQLDARARDAAQASRDEEGVCGYRNCRMRGVAMAENVLWALEREGPRGRIFLFEHLLHLDKGMPDIAAAHLHEVLGAQVKTIGLLGVESIDYGNPRHTCPARSTSLVDLLDTAGSALFLLDIRRMPPLRTAPREQGSSWCNLHVSPLWRVQDSYDALVYMKPRT